jgi:uncharacterized protein YrrD
MKFSELKGRAVVNLENAEKIGELADLLIEPGSHRILSLKVRTGLFHSAKVVPVSDVKNVGADAITISLGGIPSDPTADIAAPGAAGNDHIPTAAQQVSAVSDSTQSPIDVTSILGNKVVTDAGTMVGELHDVIIDWSNLCITGYEVHQGGLFAKSKEFAATPEVRYGNKMITMPAHLLSQPA